MRALVLAFALPLVPAPVDAGAWPRAQGETYVLLGHEGGGDGWAGLYAERGGPWGLTFGLDAGAEPGVMDEADADARLRGFARLPVPLPWEPWRLAVEAGLGADVATTDDPSLPMTYAPRAGLGLAVGRPLATPIGDGWANVDLRADRRLSGGTGAVGPERRVVLGATLGARPAPGHAVELGLHVEWDSDGGRFGALGPTWQRDVGRLGSVRLGVAITERGEARLRLGFARSFGAAR